MKLRLPIRYWSAMWINLLVIPLAILISILYYSEFRAALDKRVLLQLTSIKQLKRVQIQEYLTAGIQNMMVLLRHIKEPAPALGRVDPKPRYQKPYFSLKQLFFYFKKEVTRGINQFFTIKCYQGII